MRALFWVVAFCAVSASAYAQSSPGERLKILQGDPVGLKSAIEVGRKASFFCANCHGETGVSKSPDVPNLAGQNPAYLLEQIRKFGNGERQDAFMQGLIKVLKDDERIQLALFYAAQSMPPAKANTQLLARGKELFSKLCVRCHGEQAHGNDIYPRLACQNAVYLQASVTRYRDTPTVRNYPLMSVATAPLKNDDIVAIAHYLAQ